MYKEDLYTIIGNMYGGPAISLPLCKLKGFEEKDGKVCSEEFDCLKSQDALPIGIQLMANVEDESNLLQIAKKIEAIVEWKGWENV
jgi:Asp-tRNA(Asn)/Glu-tRNA(Gln) amidotransferase A subunit family amidase